MNRCLGKLAPRHDPRTLRLSRYIRPTLPTPPAGIDYSTGLTYGCLMNDQIGDCAIAGPDHLEQTWTGDAAGAECAITDAQALADYIAISGYDPSQTDAQGNNLTDTGCNLLDVLKRWKNIGLAGRQIAAFAAVEPSNGLEVMQATWLFGGLLIGVQLPASAMDQTDANQPWSVVPGSPNEGGHCVCVVGYNGTGPIIVSWGQVIQMTWEFFHLYADEAWACLGADWADCSKPAPCDFDLTTLQGDLAALS